MALKASLALKTVLAAASILMLAGCPAVQQARQGTNAPDLKEPINTVCVVKHRVEQLQKKELTNAIEAGVQSTGLKTRVVDGSSLPSDCRLCLYYGIGTAENGQTKLFEYQAVLDGRPLVKGAGPVGENNTIKLSAVASYAAAYLRSLSKAPAPESKTESASTDQKQAKPASKDAMKSNTKPAAKPAVSAKEKANK